MKMSDRKKIGLIRKHKLCAIGPQKKLANEFTGDGEVIDLDEKPIESVLANLRGNEWIGIQRVELLIPRGKGVTGNREDALEAVVEGLLDVGIKLTEFDTDTTCDGIKGTLKMWKHAVARMKNRGNPGAKGAKPKHVYSQADIDLIKEVWEGSGPPNSNRIKMVQRHFPGFDQNTWYRLQANGFKPFKFKHKERNSAAD